jgi:hypothetical protein
VRPEVSTRGPARAKRSKSVWRPECDLFGDSFKQSIAVAENNVKTAEARNLLGSLVDRPEHEDYLMCQGSCVLTSSSVNNRDWRGLEPQKILGGPGKAVAIPEGSTSEGEGVAAAETESAVVLSPLAALRRTT